jgi:hypothetical protein
LIGEFFVELFFYHISSLGLYIHPNCLIYYSPLILHQLKECGHIYQLDAWIKALGFFYQVNIPFRAF